MTLQQKQQQQKQQQQEIEVGGLSPECMWVRMKMKVSALEGNSSMAIGVSSS